MCGPCFPPNEKEQTRNVRTEGNAPVVDGDEDCGEAEVENDFQRVEEDAFGRSNISCCFALDALAGGRAGQLGAVGGEIFFSVWGGRFGGFKSLKRYR